VRHSPAPTGWCSRPFSGAAAGSDGRPDVLPSLVHELGGFGEALRQLDGQAIPAAEDIACVFLGECAAPGSDDHALMALWDTLQQISGEMEAGEITKCTFRCDAAKRSPAAGDPRLGEAPVGSADHQP